MSDQATPGWHHDTVGSYLLRSNREFAVNQGHVAAAFCQAVISATALAGLGLLFAGMFPPFPNHVSSVSSEAVPLPM